MWNFSKSILLIQLPRLGFCTQFDRDKGCVSIEYGDTYWQHDTDYCDINTAMVDAMEPFLSKIYAKSAQPRVLDTINVFGMPASRDG